MRLVRFARVRLLSYAKPIPTVLQPTDVIENTAHSHQLFKTLSVAPAGV